MAATLLRGLSNESRVKMKLTGQKIPLTQTILARIADELALIRWLNTKDAQDGTNKPKSILLSLLGEDDDKEECEGYNTPEEFKAQWNKIA